MNKWTAIHAREVPPVEGETQRRCWTILGPDPISQCVFFNGHEGEHDFWGASRAAVVREIRGRLFEAAWRRDDREWLDPKIVSRILDEVEQ